MNKVLKMVDGYKSFIFMGLAVVIKIADIYELLDPKLYEALMIADLGLLGGSVKHAVTKLVK